MKKYLFSLIIAVALLAGLSEAPAFTATLLAVAAVVALAVFYVANTSRQTRRAGLIAGTNTLPPNFGTHENSITLLSSAAVATRYLLGKRGADVSHVAAIAAAADEPLCVMTDEAAAAEEPIDCEMLGVANRTVPVVAKVACDLDADLYSNGDGKVTIKPTAAGTYWRVGRAMAAATADNDVIAMLPIKPRKLIVLAALTNVSGDIADTNSTAVNPTKSDFDSLLVAAGKLQADFLLLAAALKTGAEIDYATT